jgi:hypothetical protein
LHGCFQGFEDALAAGVKEIAVFASASEYPSLCRTLAVPLRRALIGTVLLLLLLLRNMDSVSVGELLVSLTLKQVPVKN